MPKFRVSTRTTCFHCHCVERLLNSLAETTHNAKTPTYRPNNKHYVLSNLAEPKACPKLKCSCCYVIKSCLASAFSGVQMQHWMQNLIFNGFTLDLLRQWRRFHAVAVMQLLFMPSFIFVHGEHAQWVHLLPFKFQQFSDYSEHAETEIHLKSTSCSLPQPQRIVIVCKWRHINTTSMNRITDG